MHENKRDLRTRLPGKTQYAKQCFLATTTELKSNEKTRQNTYKLLFSSAVQLLLQIARKRLFHTRHRSITALTRPHHITVVIRRGGEEAGRERFPPRPRHLSVEIGEKKGRLPCGGEVLNRRKRSTNLPF